MSIVQQIAIIIVFLALSLIALVEFLVSRSRAQRIKVLKLEKQVMLRTILDNIVQWEQGHPPARITLGILQGMAWAAYYNRSLDWTVVEYVEKMYWAKARLAVEQAIETIRKS